MRRAAGAAAAREPGFAAPAAPAGGCHPASRARAGHERGARQAFRISVTGAGGALATLAVLVAPAGVPAAGTATLRLAVPLVRQAPERCGPAALHMVDLGMLEPLADRIVLVVRSGVTPKASIQDALSTIDQSRLLGIVLNEAAASSKRWTISALTARSPVSSMP